MLLVPRMSCSPLPLSSSPSNKRKKENMVPQKRPIFDLDGLYCDEENLDEDLGDSENGSENFDQKNVGFLKRPVFLSEKELDWGDNELISLFSKEKCNLLGHIELTSIGSSMVDRKEAVEWILKVINHYGFSVLTTVLAVNYFDRFSSSVCFQREKPWMSQLAALACLSLAAKVEETQVPLLLDLQVEESKFVFEAKTIMRMELLVLSTLGWKMNPVTPISFIDYVIRRLGMNAHLGSRFLGKCEGILLSAITDPKFGSYLPSVLAAGTMLYVLKEVEPDNVLDCQNELLNILEMKRDYVDECYDFILDLGQTKKREYTSTPNSPNGVIDAYYFSSDSSNDSWILAPFMTSSPEPPFKRSRSHDQQMRVTHFRNL